MAMFEISLMCPEDRVEHLSDALAALDSAGILRTTPAERSLRIAWPDPLPEDIAQQVAAAHAKQNLGVPHDQVLAELGYAKSDTGIE